LDSYLMKQNVELLRKRIMS